MKTALIVLLALLNTPALRADCEGPQPSHSVGNGVPAFQHTAVIEAPQAGIDYPTDTAAPAKLQVLVLDSTKRVLVIEHSVAVSKPVAGIDYPTDTPPTKDLILVLRADRKLHEQRRVALRLNGIGDNLTILTSGGAEVKVSSIVRIEHAEAGVDYPTEMYRDYYVYVLADESRVAL